MPDQKETKSSERPAIVDVPPMFDWNLAHDLMAKGGTDRALVLGVSLISEQLDAIIRKLS